MPLIKCPECGKQISDRAPACPSCACPIKPITIEATGKKWKGLQLIFALLFAIAFIWTLASLSSPESSPIPALLAIIGLFGYIFSRIGSWWYHK